MTSTIITDYLGVGTSATRPTSAPVASGALAIQYATDTAVLQLWNGSAYVPFAGGGLVVESGGTALGSASTLNVNGGSVVSSGGTATITIPNGGIIVSGGGVANSGTNEIDFPNATVVSSGAKAVVTPLLAVQSGGTALGNVSAINFQTESVIVSGGVASVKELSSAPSFNSTINTSTTSVSTSVTLNPAISTRYLIMSNSGASTLRSSYSLSNSTGTLEVSNANWTSLNNGDGTLFATLLLSAGTSCILTANTTTSSSGYLSISILAIPLPP